MVLSLIITAFIGLQLLTIPDTILPEWITIFKEYPILNLGTVEGVKANFKKFSQNQHSTILIAQTDNKKIAAIASGVPLLAYTYEAELFKQHNLNPSDYFHINDVIVFPEYYNQGIGSKLYRKLEKLARKWGYKGMCLCTVERNANHPLKPLHYKDPAIFWSRLGFIPTSLKIAELWPTIMDTQETVENYENSLIFWIKEL